MLHKSTVLTAADVRRIIKHAKAVGLNQHLSELEVRGLNPNGLSILSIMTPYHQYRHGPDHHRVNAFLSVRTQKAPEEVAMDVLAEDWDELPAEAVIPGKTHQIVLPEAAVIPDALRVLIRKWISRMNHPQLSRNPQARNAYEGCIIDVQDLIKETQDA